MIVEPDLLLRADLMDNLRREYTGDTRSGTHLTSLIYCLTRAYWQEVDPLPPTEDELIMYAIGFGLERVLISRDHVEPFEVDGISLSPDFVINETYADLKSTRMSPEGKSSCGVCGEPYTGHSKAKNGHVYVAVKAGFEVPLGWQKQVMGYRHALNLLAGDVAYDYSLAILHLIPAQLVALRLTFTQDELEENWRWLLGRKYTLKHMLHFGEPEPFKHRLYESECDNCRHSLKCQLLASLEVKGATHE